MLDLNATTGIDWTLCPLVERNPLKLGGSAVVRDSRLPVDVIVENYLSGSPVEEIEENFGVPKATILAVLRYAAQRDPDIEL